MAARNQYEYVKIEGDGLENLKRTLKRSLLRFIAPLQIGACLDFVVIGTEALSKMTKGKREWDRNSDAKNVKAIANLQPVTDLWKEENYWQSFYFEVDFDWDKLQ